MIDSSSSFPWSPVNPSPPRSSDAVVIVPGIMGSELREVGTERVLWGMGAALQYAARVKYRERLRLLAATAQEQRGELTRIEAPRLLATADWLPLVGGFEPYRNLVQRCQENVIHRDAVLEFSYDWRLSVEQNAPLLASAARSHLARWDRHVALAEQREEFQAALRPRLIFVAHSMGGLVVRALGALPGEPLDIRAVVTLGTPFHGSIKALELIATGEGAPLPMPAAAVRDLSRTLPGVYDLLPWYRCRVVEGEGIDRDVVALTVDDVVGLGGDRQLTTEALERYERLRRVPLPGHVAVVGTSQSTVQTLRLRNGRMIGQLFGYDRDENDELTRSRSRIGQLHIIDHGGDGTVYRYAGNLSGVAETTIAQQHAALARTPTALDVVAGVLTRPGRLGARLGAAEIGLDVPESVEIGEALPIRITGNVDSSITTCSIEDATNRDEVVARPPVVGRPVDGALVIEAVMPRRGLFRVLVGAGSDPVSKLVMVGGGDVLDG